jgi:hypothetical protein
VFLASGKCGTVIAYISSMNNLRERMIVIVHARHSDRKVHTETRL